MRMEGYNMSVKNLNNFYRAWYEVELVRCLFLCVKKARLFLADFKGRYLIKLKQKYTGSEILELSFNSPKGRYLIKPLEF